MTGSYADKQCSLPKGSTIERQMRILQLGKFYPVRGGVEKVMYDLTRGISSLGIRCDMMCAASEGPTRVEKVNDNADLILCHTVRKVAGTMLSPAMITDLRRRCGDYDIIHIHHPDPMAALALRLSGYKGRVILHWHSDILKQKFLLKFYLPVQNWLIDRAEKIVGTTLHYIRNSPFLTGRESKFERLLIGIDQVVPDTEGVAAIKTRYPGKRIIFSLGRLVEYKGFRHLVSAAEFIPDDYVLLIGGTGPLHDGLTALIREKNLEDKVKLLGYVPDNEVYDYFGAADVFCLSSVKKTEAFGIVQIEAMSCGVPVIATKIPGSGVPVVNEDGVSGINVEPGSAEAIASAVLRITSDRDSWKTYSEGARNRYRTYFTKDKMISDCIELYHHDN